MFSNYLKIAWRNLWKHKTFSAIIIFGMSVAIAASLLLSLTAYHELSYDQFHKNKPHLYQLYFEEHRVNEVEKNSSMPVPLTPALKQEYSDVIHISRYSNGAGDLARYGNKELDLSIRSVDPDFLKMFSFPLLRGNQQSPLAGLQDVVVTEDCAKKLFNSDNPVGKTFEISINHEWKNFRVTAVAANFPANSSFRFDILTRFEHTPSYQQNIDKWDNRNHEVFIQLNENVQQGAFEKRLFAFSKKHFGERISEMKRDGAQPDAEGQYIRLRMIPFTEIHFSNISGTGSGVKKFYPYLLLIISAFILFIACVNFVNLSLARSLGRAKEIGLRKVMGAFRWQLIAQFWGEAAIISFFALLVGSGIAYLLLPSYKTVFYPLLSIGLLQTPAVIVYIIIGFILITLFAGGYPAWVISAFNTVQSVKGKLTTGKSHRLRNTLMVVQFVLASLLMICTFIAWQQIDYLRKKSLGYNKEEVISIPVGNKIEGNKALDLLRTRLAAEPNVISVTGADINMGLGRDGSSSNSVIGFDYKDRNIKTHFLRIDYDFLQTLDIQLLKGRDFDRSYGMDSNAVLINEQMAQQLGEKDAVGKVIELLDEKGQQVIGVVKDFHFKSLHRELEPLSMSMYHEWAVEYLFVRVRPGNTAANMEMVQRAWKEVNPGNEYAMSFLDENTDRMYRDEARISKIFMSGALLAIIISCTGLFAIVLLVITQRTKEIGIRKLLGAGIPHIVGLISKDFLKLVLLAILIASPLAWYVMHSWLEEYAYRITISWWVFAVAGLVALLIAFLTLGIQSVKAALNNPVDNLKNE